MARVFKPGTLERERQNRQTRIRMRVVRLRDRLWFLHDEWDRLFKEMWEAPENQRRRWERQLDQNGTLQYEVIWKFMEHPEHEGLLSDPDLDRRIFPDPPA